MPSRADLTRLDAKFGAGIKIDNADRSHADVLAPRLRRTDLAQVKALSGHAGIEALLDYFDRSIYCLSIIRNGEPIGMFGVLPTQNPVKAQIWLLGSRQLGRHARALLKHAGTYLDLLAKDKYALISLTDCRDIASTRILQILGFTIVKLHHNVGFESRGFWECEFGKAKKFRPLLSRPNSRPVYNNVIFGASGYVGSNLTKQLGLQKNLCIGRHTAENGGDHVVIDLAADTIGKRHRLLRLKTGRVIICSRPVELVYQTNSVFYSNLRRILLSMIEYAGLREIHFLSTTNVYDFEDGDFNPLQKSPHGLYEFFKLETELFLRYLSLVVRGDIDYNVYRLPVIVGGQYEKNQTPQVMQVLLDQYLSGQHWDFDSDEDKRLGTSWLDVADLARIISTHRYKCGEYNIHNPSNGFISYYDLQNLFDRHFRVDKKSSKRLRKLRLEITNNTAVKEKSLEPCLIPFLKKHLD